MFVRAERRLRVGSDHPSLDVKAIRRRRCCLSRAVGEIQAAKQRDASHLLHALRACQGPGRFVVSLPARSPSRPLVLEPDHTGVTLAQFGELPAQRRSPRGPASDPQTLAETPPIGEAASSAFP